MKYFDFLVNKIHTVIAATVDENHLPVTCAIDIMDYDESGLYFLTAKGKNFYKRLISTQYLSLTGLYGNSTLSRIAVSVNGLVKEIGQERLKKLLEKNRYMYEIYPTENSRYALTVFQIYSGTLEWFDLSKKPIERSSFSFGNSVSPQSGYYISNGCIGCKKCLAVCPQNCISIELKAEIKQANCLHCGNCFQICPAKAVVRR